MSQISANPSAGAAPAKTEDVSAVEDPPAGPDTKSDVKGPDTKSDSKDVKSPDAKDVKGGATPADIDDGCMCPICHEIYNNPLFPVCGHALCKSCLTQLEEKICPVCKTPTDHYGRVIAFEKALRALHPQAPAINPASPPIDISLAKVRERQALLVDLCTKMNILRFKLLILQVSTGEKQAIKCVIENESFYEPSFTKTDEYRALERELILQTARDGRPEKDRINVALDWNLCFNRDAIFKELRAWGATITSFRIGSGRTEIFVSW